MHFKPGSGPYWCKQTDQQTEWLWAAATKHTLNTRITGGWKCYRLDYYASLKHFVIALYAFLCEHQPSSSNRQHPPSCLHKSYHLSIAIKQDNHQPIKDYIPHSHSFLMLWIVWHNNRLRFECKCSWHMGLCSHISCSRLLNKKVVFSLLHLFILNYSPKCISRAMASFIQYEQISSV